MIYCVEDDKAVRDLVLYTLKSAGYKAEGFSDGKKFWEALKEKKPKLILLDIMLPGEDGITLLRKLKDSPLTADIPVIMSTAKDTEFDKVIGLDAGADDYLCKPFGMMEMLSRIRAVLRRTTPKEAVVHTVGDVVVDEGRHIVLVKDRQVSLTLKEYELLKLFMENTGQVFTREILLSKIWGLDFIGETRTVDVHIGTLRTKLAECGDMIKTVRGVGYKMEATDEQEDL